MFHRERFDGLLYTWSHYLAQNMPHTPCGMTSMKMREYSTGILGNYCICSAVQVRRSRLGRLYCGVMSRVIRIFVNGQLEPGTAPRLEINHPSAVVISTKHCLGPCISRSLLFPSFRRLRSFLTYLQASTSLTCPDDKRSVKHVLIPVVLSCPTTPRRGPLCGSAGP
ncbi:hypothetical protein P154DRAFT_229534 [Amniculicola lignicola CBS 123094]|uniref:Uncharacterized protein n=1 Tax=Amniculicola lignicola CBS 123094 TaxID=1392246 RepID=A0A6A5WEY9_9PLEO|nr:hypothetical protein P154DRAFT_229534 [Amniculicola lignicola CBS 123094]